MVVNTATLVGCGDRGSIRKAHCTFRESNPRPPFPHIGRGRTGISWWGVVGGEEDLGAPASHLMVGRVLEVVVALALGPREAGASVEVAEKQVGSQGGDGTHGLGAGLDIVSVL